MRSILIYTLTVLRRRKRNFLLTSLAIALGISLIVQSQILGDTIERNYLEVMVEAFGNTDIIVFSSGNNIYFEYEVYETVSNALSSEFKGILPNIGQLSTIYYPERGQFEQYCLLETIGEEFDSAYWGKIFSNSSGVEIDIASLAPNEIVISPELADALLTPIGTQITISLYNEKGIQTFFNATVVDIYSYEGYGKVGNPNDYRRILMSLQALQSLIRVEMTRPLTQILFGIDDHQEPFLGRERSNEARDKIKSVLEETYSDDSFMVFTLRENVRESIEGGVSNYIDTLLMFGTVVIIAGLLLITNIQLLNMEERKQQIGMLRAIGVKKSEILFSYGIETILTGIVGGILGMIFGIGVAIWLNDVSRGMLSAWGNPDFKQSMFDVVLNPDSFLLSLSAAVVLSLITGMVPALRARGSSIVEVLRGTSSVASSISSTSNDKKPLWPIIVGTIVTLIGIYLLVDLIQQGHPFYSEEGYHNLDEEFADNFHALFLIILGFLFVNFRFEKKRLGLTFAGVLMISLTLFGYQVAVDWITEGGNANRIGIIGLLCVVTGVTAIIAANLEIITEGLRKSLTLIGFSATGLVATRYINSRKTRAVLTFATFAVILSLNFMGGTYAETQSYGSGEMWEDYFTDIQIVVESQTSVDLNTVNLPQILQEQFDEVKIVYPLTTAWGRIYPDPKHEINENSTRFTAKFVLLDFETFQDANSHAILPFLFSDLVPKYSKMSMLDRVRHRDSARKEANTFWDDFLAGKYLHRETLEPVDPNDPKGLPMFISEGLGFIEEGRIVSFPLANGSGYIEMIKAATLTYFPSFNLYTGTYQSGIIFSDDFASQIDIRGLGVREFLTEPKFGFDFHKNKILCKKIEEFSNKPSSNSLLNHTNGALYGITAYNLWDVIFHDLTANRRSLELIQLFISTGLIIGVLGLLIVSHRSVIERKREIGMLRALGFSRNAVTLAVLLELLFLGILGFIVGFFTGNYIAWIFADLQDWNLRIPWIQVGFFGTFILGSVIIAAAIPGWLAARIQPSEALRYSG
ncbi:MAG: ABC transporter permease [Promethearchaeota archaeon]